MIGGRYDLDHKIGRGGMGSVWLARDVVLGRTVAVKKVGVAPGGSSPDLLRAEREARIAASINHPHVVGVFDLVNEGDEQWLVMEYVPGTTLAELVRSGTPPPASDVAEVLEQIAQALTAAHAAGVVHRDVKPSNILVRDDGDAKLSDFGIARMNRDASLTQTGLVTGSPAYLAPEVASGRQATSASDVWSFGATAFHACLGRPPFEVNGDVLGALYRIVNEAPPRLPMTADRRLAELVAHTMVTDPEQRWPMARVADHLAERRAGHRVGGAEAPPAMPAAVAMPVTEPVAEPAPPVVEPAVPSGTAPAPEPQAEPVPAPYTLAPEPSSGRPVRRRRRGLPIAVGTLVVALIVLIVVLALQKDPQHVPDNADTPSGPSSSAGHEPTSNAPVAQPDAQGMRSFIADYLTTAARDPLAGYKDLTGAYKVTSGMFAGYRSFWGSVSHVQLLGPVQADPLKLTVHYVYRYRVAGHRHDTTDHVALQLSFDPDSRTYQIAGVLDGDG